MSFFQARKQAMVESTQALAGRSTPIAIGGSHLVLGRPLDSPTPAGYEEAILGMGCFWGAERIFWQLPGVYLTAVGYAGGYTENPTYEEVCSGKTGHAEVVRVVYDPNVTNFGELLRVFFEEHDPTQLMRQGNDIGTQYRSVIYTSTKQQHELALATAKSYSERLVAAGFGPVVTEIKSIDELDSTKPFFFAENYHQQYLAANPNGYCGLAGTGMSCQVGLLS